MNEFRGLRWGVRGSLLRYLGALSDSTIEVTGGATRLDEGPFRFPLSHQDPTSTHFSGAVTLSGHGGLLHLVVDSPRISIEGMHGVISVMHQGAWLELAHSSLTYTSDGYSSDDVRLSRDGADLFDGQYFEGDPLDPFRVFL